MTMGYVISTTIMNYYYQLLLLTFLNFSNLQKNHSAILDHGTGTGKNTDGAPSVPVDQKGLSICTSNTKILKTHEGMLEP
jgi:hypothetical protein